MTIDCIICDIDGTLADISHRVGYVTGTHRDYDKFYDPALMIHDGVFEDIVNVINILSDVGETIVMCSGRPEKCRDVTEEWLETAGIYDHVRLYMRPDNDTRPDHVIKLELLHQMRADGFKPWLAIDDRPSIVKMWRDNGITCLQCRDWNETPKMKEYGLLTLMIGPSGAGKSTWLMHSDNTARFSIDQTHVVSSDQIRADLCGDFKDQSKNAQVFAALHAVVKTRVECGLPTVVDATNIRDADRKAIVALTKGRVRYIVLNRSMEDKRASGGWRNELGFDLLDKHEQTFRSNLKAILAGDNDPKVTVFDLRD